MRLSASAAYAVATQDFSSIFSGPLKPIGVAVPLVPMRAGGPRAPSLPSSLRLLSWNLLAPPYVRQSESEEAWRRRARRQIELVEARNPDVLGLQEFYSSEEGFVNLWQDFASAHGYVMHVCPRVDRKRDGCAMLVRDALVASCSFDAFTYDDWGSRILQVANLKLADGQPLVLMQTHLTFPHASAHDPPMRREQARKLAELVREQAAPTCVFGDLNGDPDDPAVGVLTSLGGLRPMPPAPDGQRWVSHVAHTGAEMACDLYLTRGACVVRGWEMGGTRENLVAGGWLSDHRPVEATLLVGPEAAAEAAEEEEGPSMC